MMTTIAAMACLLVTLAPQAKTAKDKGLKDTPDAIIEQTDLIGPLAFGPDGIRIAGMVRTDANIDFTVHQSMDAVLFNFKTLSRDRSYGTGLEAPATDATGRETLLVFSSDSSLLLGGGRNYKLGGTANVFNVKSALYGAYLAAHTGKIEAIAFSPDGTAIITSGYDGDDANPAGRKYTLRTWPIPEYVGEGVARGTMTPTKSIELKLASSDLLLGPGPGEIVVRPSELGYEVAEMESGKIVRKVESRNGLGEAIFAGNSSCFSPNKKFLAIASETKGTTIEAGRKGGRLRIWEVESGTLRHDLLQLDIARYVSFSPDGKSVAVTASQHAGFGAGVINIYDVESGKLQRTIKGEFGFAAFEPLGRWLVASSPKGILLWKTGK
jgi:WD40 repeat protein